MMGSIKEYGEAEILVEIKVDSRRQNEAFSSLGSDEKQARVQEQVQEKKTLQIISGKWKIRWKDI